MRRDFAANTKLDTDAVNVVWRFDPYDPVRRDHTGEVAYLESWHKAMGGKAQTIDEYFLREEPQLFPFLRVMHGLPGGWKPEDCRMVTTFMKWLGTGNGRGYRHEAGLMSKQATLPGRPGGAYVAAWALQNLRHRDRTYCPRDFMLEAKYPERCAAQGALKDFMRDFDVLDKAAAWLGTEEGQKFLKEAEQRHRRLELKVRRDHHIGSGPAF